MSRLKIWTLLTFSLGALPAMAYGGWASDIFGIGQGAEAVAEATVWVKLISAVQGSLPVLMFLLMALLAMIQLVTAQKVNNDFSSVFKEAMKDGTITWKELTFLGWQGLITAVLVLALVGAALFEFYVMYSGFSDLMSFKSSK